MRPFICAKSTFVDEGDYIRMVIYPSQRVDSDSRYKPLDLHPFRQFGMYVISSPYFSIPQ